jgi:hypothetical protein
MSVLRLIGAGIKHVGFFVAFLCVLILSAVLPED